MAVSVKLGKPGFIFLGLGAIILSLSFVFKDYSNPKDLKPNSVGLFTKNVSPMASHLDDTVLFGQSDTALDANLLAQQNQALEPVGISIIPDRFSNLP